jgi:divalent metal cation (Fe/Co/Zn/Cd) transporter
MRKSEWIAKARFLALFTLAYNLAEAAACGIWGVKDQSLSLLGFGADSLIEAASAGVILWSLGGHLKAKRERAAQQLIGVLLLSLALFLVISACFTWSKGMAPLSGLPGAIIACVSLGVMAWLYLQKRAVAEALKNKALKADAFCTLSCMALSGLLLLGSLAFAGTGKAWFDAATALGMAVLIAREGAEEYDESQGKEAHEHD